MRRYATGLAVLLGLGLTLYPIVKTSEITGVTALGGLGLAFLVVALTWRSARSLAVPAVILIALHYALALHIAHAGLDVYSVLVGAGLFLVFEAADMAIALADVAPAARPALVYRAVLGAATAAGGAAVAVIAVFARSLLAGGVIVVVVGGLCVLALVALPLSLPARGTSLKE